MAQEIAKSLRAGAEVKLADFGTFKLSGGAPVFKPASAFTARLEE